MLYALASLLLVTQRLQPDLDPREYRSPSGEYVLRVDPSARDGSGLATYALSRAGAGVWSRELAFTLRDAVVADSVTLEVFQNGAHVRVYPSLTDAENAANARGGNAAAFQCTIGIVD